MLARTLATGVPFVTEYTYEAGRQKGSSTDDPTLTTTLIKTVKNGNDTLEYTYDQLGNITQIKKNGTVVESYTYDNLNQLKTVTRGSDTWEYTYDNGGNILSVKKNGAVIKNYGYTDSTWKDLLTSYNGSTITYDEIGNPIDYRDGFWFDWNNQRKLTSFCYADQACDFTYDQNGLRVSKYNYLTDETTNYYWLNGVLQAQKTGSEYIVFLHDESGNAYGFLLKNGSTEEYYYYIFNAQGDVIGIVDSQGTLVVEYTYSAWGEILSITGSKDSTIGQKNPLRYRGYYYDNESGLYYLQSRYYDPVTGRFLNADSFVSTGQGILSYNMFAYCMNNPIVQIDPTGRFAQIVYNLFMIALEEDGNQTNPPDHPDFEPPKKGNKRVKNPNGKGTGWQAKDGGVWVWTPKMHGGAGWTIQYPNGGHSHAYPGGKVRNHFRRAQSSSKSSIMIFVGLVATVGLVIDDISGAGVADNFLLPQAIGCFVAGLDGILGKKICSVCGEVKYGY